MNACANPAAVFGRSASSGRPEDATTVKEIADLFRQQHVRKQTT